MKNIFKRIARRLVLAVMTLISSSPAVADKDWAQFGRYEEENAGVKANSGTARPKVVFIGNSITEGWVKAHPEFFKVNNFVGRGISGQTSYQILLRFREDVVALNPEIVVINAGTNDIAENNHFYNERRTLGNIISMAEIAGSNGIKVALSSVLPAARIHWNNKVGDVAEKVKSLNEKIKAYADEKGLLYIDYYSALIGENAAMKPEYSGDGIHPTPEGYDVMESVVKTLLK